MKTRWAPSRTIYAVLTAASTLVLVYGIYLYLSGSGSVASASTNTTPEDWSSVFGYFAEFVGFGLIVIAGVLCLLFGSLYLHATRRMRHIPLATKK